MDLRELWVLLEADLGGARRTLLASAEENTAGLQYQEFIDHNELELACDMLAAYALDHPVSRECWVALRDDCRSGRASMTRTVNPSRWPLDEQSTMRYRDGFTWK